MRIKSKIHVKKHYILYIVAGCVLGGMTAMGTVDNPVSGLTYQTSVTNSFKIEPSVSISLSSSELKIEGLTPNSSKESNVLTITAESNSGGYTLYSTVGGSLESATYDSTDLQHKTNYDSSNDNTRFVNLASKVDYTKDGTNLTGGTWGYTFTTSADSDDAWEKFSGLPLNGSGDMAKLIDTDSPSTAAVKFKIAAAATDAQISGEYNNVINFIASPEYTPSAPAKTYMQDLTSTSIATLLPNVGDKTTVVDSRDNTEYTIAKLADNKYWMLDNLALDISSVSLDNLKGKTNAGDTALTYLKNGGGSSPYPANGIVADTIDNHTWTSNVYENPYISLSSTCYNANCVDDPASGQWNKDAVATHTGNGSGKIGVYYNYCAASAGSWCYTSGNPSSDPDTSTLQDVTEDICPAGWRMPTGGGDDGEYVKLYAEYEGADEFKAALSTPLSGYFYSGSARNQGSYGDFWSSTYNSGNGMYYLGVFASSVRPSNVNNRNFGYSVRCVFGS